MEQYTKNDLYYMEYACDIAENNINSRGGPFGAVIVHSETNSIVGIGENMVRILNDPTMHAEVVAIRHACKTLKTHDLSMCKIYTSCEPCPMCFSAIFWARIPTVFYGNTKADAADIGFDDAAIYEEIAKPIGERTRMRMTQCGSERAKVAFRQWQNTENKNKY
jgi:tRNA(Arg) A34 adenosine deaminase TadA